MQNMLPLPTIDYTPAALKGDTDIIALTDFLDAEYMRWYQETKNLDTLKDPARAPEVCLNVFGDWLSADIKDRDSDRTKRAKIYNAVENTKLLSTWDFSAKPMIDAHVGGDCSIVSGIVGDDMVLCGSADDPDYKWFVLGGLDVDADYGTRLVGGAGIVTYSTNIITKQQDQMLLCGIDCLSDVFSFGLGGLSSGASYGARLLGDGTEFDTVTADYVEPMIKGTILVDVDSSTLTANDVEALKADLKDIAPCYFKVYLGYMNGTGGTFVPYSNGLVGT